MPDAPLLVTLGIPAIALGLAALLVIAHRVVGAGTAPAAATLALWLAGFGVVAGAGVLARFEARPPPMAIMIVVALAATLWFATSRRSAPLVDGLPLAALVGFQAFRLPLELVMHEAARAGVMPEVMTFTGAGRNFDIVTGITAAVLAVLIARGQASRTLVLAWNLLGLGLLLTIMAIAIAASPIFRAFGDDPAVVNSWIAYFPYVYLPTVLVPFALTGHILVFRKLRATRPLR